MRSRVFSWRVVQLNCGFVARPPAFPENTSRHMVAAAAGSLLQRSIGKIPGALLLRPPLFEPMLECVVGARFSFEPQVGALAQKASFLASRVGMLPVSQRAPHRLDGAEPIFRVSQFYIVSD